MISSPTGVWTNLFVAPVLERSNNGRHGESRSGLIFADDDDVVPDVIWISHDRLQTALWEDGKLHTSPELVVEVLSPGSSNERRDRELKLKLYSRRGADEYWIVNWREQRIEVYRRQNAVLTLQETLNEDNLLQSPLLPGFSCHVRQFFVGAARP